MVYIVKKTSWYPLPGIILTIILALKLFGQVSNSGKGDSDGIVISGHRRTLTSTPGGIGILSSDSIMKRVPVSISDALQDITGVYRASDSSWGSEISIRGAGRDKVIMVIDGSRMNASTDIGAQFGTLNPASIERVEVFKGPISSLYGSGSTGGVVNIYTRTGKFTGEPGFLSGVNVSYENNSSGVNTYGFTSYNSRDWYLFGSGSCRKHDNYTDGGGDNVGNSGFNDAEGVLNIGLSPASGHTIELRSQYYEGRDIGITGARDSVPLTASAAEYKKIIRGLISLDYRIVPAGETWMESAFHLYWMYLKREVCIINSTLRIEPESDNRTAGGQWLNTFAWNNNRLAAGIDTWIRTISTDRKRTDTTSGLLVIDDTPIPDSYYLSSGIFAEDDMQFAGFTINFGGRFDLIYTGNDKIYKSEYPASSVIIWKEQDVHDYSWNGHAGVSYELSSNFSMALLAASGYRAASLEERYKYITLGGGVEKWGDPGLDPERSWFFEYSMHYKNSWLKTDASAYLNLLRDLISEQQVSASEYRLQNIDRARLLGADYDISIKTAAWLELYNNLSYTRGTDTRNGGDLPAIAPLRIVSGIKYNAAYGISGFADGTWTAAQKNVTDGLNKSRSWFRLDTGVDFRFTSGGFDHKVSLICTNLLDREYYDYMSMSKTGYAFNEPGRSVICAYSATF